MKEYWYQKDFCNRIDAISCKSLAIFKNPANYAFLRSCSFCKVMDEVAMKKNLHSGLNYLSIV